MKMPFILDIPRLANPTGEEVVSRWKAYADYLESTRGKLAPGAFEYAMSTWHRDYTHRMSPHDSWLERVSIDEPSSGDRSQNRSVQVTVELLASHHDGRIRFTYVDIKSYRMEMPAEFERPPYGVGHGDLLADEVSLSDRGLVLHQFLFSRGATWSIEAGDLRYEWLQL
jgi:hypothetical protein